MQYPLQLTPLPIVSSENDRAEPSMQMQGFVDDEVVTAILSMPTVSTRLTASRVPVSPEMGLVLSSSDEDYAGWRTPPSVIATKRGIVAENPSQPPLVLRRATPPHLEDPEFAPAQSSGHRWWLAGVTGVVSTLVFFILLLTLARHPEPLQAGRPNPPQIHATSPAPTAGQTSIPKTPKAQAITTAVTLKP